MAFPNEESRLIYTHKLSYLLHNKIRDVPQGTEVSHLCHEPRCIRGDHLVAEPHEVNLERITCKKQNRCTYNHYPFCIV